jgi:hypothetical protein
MESNFKIGSRIKFTETKYLENYKPNERKIGSISITQDELLDYNDCSMEKSSIKFIR